MSHAVSGLREKRCMKLPASGGLSRTNDRAAQEQVIEPLSKDSVTLSRRPIARTDVRSPQVARGGRNEPL